MAAITSDRIDAQLPSDADDVPINDEFADLEKLQKSNCQQVDHGSLGKRDLKRIELLNGVERSGKCPARSAAGVASMREMSAQERAVYDKIADKDKEAFRIRWCKTSAGMLLAKRKEKLEKWQLIDSTIGRYMSISKAWQEEGGQKCDIAPTRKLASKLLAMGPPWARFNPLTERNDIFFVRIEHRETFVQSWSLFKEWQDRAGTPTPSQVVAGKGVGSKGARPIADVKDREQPVEQVPNQPPQTQQVVPLKRKKQQAETTEAALMTTPPQKRASHPGIKRGRSSIDLGMLTAQDMQKTPPKARDMEVNAQQVRKNYMETMVVASNLSNSVGMKEDKKWAKIAGMTTDMKAYQNKISSFVAGSGFAARFINLDFNALKICTATTPTSASSSVQPPDNWHRWCRSCTTRSACSTISTHRCLMCRLNDS